MFWLFQVKLRCEVLVVWSKPKKCEILLRFHAESVKIHTNIWFILTIITIDNQEPYHKNSWHTIWFVS